MSEAKDLEPPPLGNQGEVLPEREEGARPEAGEGAGGSADAPYTVRLPMFEGPLDLLLHLCQKHELNVLDIPIAFITEKYLEYLAVMRLMNLDLAAEYLLMAATLAHIKSKMLLPAPPPGQEDDEADPGLEQDPREALIRRLLEYQKYKEAAEQLAARGVAGRDVFFRGAPIEEAVHSGLPPLAEVPLFALVEAFQRVLAKSKVKLTHDVVADRISLTDRIHELTALLSSRGRVLFEDLFLGPDAPRTDPSAPTPLVPQEVTRFDLVITFLALLEMTRLRMTRLYQAGPLEPLYVEMTEGNKTNEGLESSTFEPAADVAHGEDVGPNEVVGTGEGDGATDASPPEASEGDEP